MKTDILVVGGGPVGLALAIHAARRGLAVTVLERGHYPLDKACGEGLLPAGRRALETLGLSLSPADACPLEGVRYLQENGDCAEARFSSGDGIGIRRPALVEALRQRALGAGAAIREGAAVRHMERNAANVRAWLDSEELNASLMVAADGLHSPLRRSQGVEIAFERRPRRYGLRRHFAMRPWTSFVEVHFAAAVEAYVTPVGRTRVGVALLFDEHAVPVSFEALLHRFPRLAERLAGAIPDSDVRGAGPLWQEARTPVLDRFVLLGDAAGYVDAITGEGLSLGLRSAEHLGTLLPQALSRGASRGALLPYEEAWRQEFNAYARLARTLLWISQRPWLRRRVVALLSQHPALLQRIVGRVVSESHLSSEPIGGLR
jgi:flavin-dependent dehydrogenase